MKSLMKMRHYCDFCKKSGGAKGHIAKHEAGCTANPARKCGLCEYAGGGEHTLLELIATYEKEGWSALREAAGECPGCILATLRQAGIVNADHPLWAKAFEFDFKAELKMLWANVNADKPQYY